MLLCPLRGHEPGRRDQALLLIMGEQGWQPLFSGMCLMHELIFATSNPAKLSQLAFVIDQLMVPFCLVSAQERYGDRAHYVEQGNTAASIAENGARQLARRLGVPIVTEDTTFHVEALGGQPGVRAGTYLAEHGRIGILRALVGAASRRATIVSAVAWATPEGDSQTWVTALDGQVSSRERWTAGQPDWLAPTPDNPLGGGYNAIFIPDGSMLTLAEVPPADSLHVGYREPNFCALLAFLASWHRGEADTGESGT